MIKEWKLICKDKTEGGSLKKEKYTKPFVGTFNDLIIEMKKVNDNNYSYKIIDFEFVENEQPKFTKDEIQIEINENQYLLLKNKK